jgi:glycosyltransferase involved in cell wall biosynthesis
VTASWSGAWPTVSVIVPTRDRPELLRAAIGSIRSQDYPGDIEILVTYDQSEPDESLNVDDPHRTVRVITNTRTQGLAGNRNTGILASTGDFVAFCDDDDEWLPGKLTAQITAMLGAPEAEMCTTGVRVAYDGSTTDRVLARDRVTLADLLRSRLQELHPSSFLMRRSALVDGIGLVDEAVPGSYGEDYEFLLRAARRTPIVNVPEVGVVALWHRQSYFTARWTTIATALEWLLERYPEFRSDPRGLARITGQIAFARAASGSRRSAMGWTGRTIRHSPREPRAYLALAVASRMVKADTVLGRLHRSGRGI